MIYYKVIILEKVEFFQTNSEGCVNYVFLSYPFISPFPFLSLNCCFILPNKNVTRSVL